MVWVGRKAQLFHTLPSLGESQLFADVAGQRLTGPDAPPLNSPFLSTVSASAPPSSSAANPSARAINATGRFPLMRAR